MVVSAYAYTNRGGRDHNEDSLRSAADQGVFVLADGLGGHCRGEVASALAADTLFTAMTQAEALDGEALTHSPQPTQQQGSFSILPVASLRESTRVAPCSQARTQAPQPMHRSG